MEKINSTLASKSWKRSTGNPGWTNFRPRQYKKNRFYIDNEFLEHEYPALTGNKQLLPVYTVLAKHAHSQTHQCFPSYETIMRMTGIKNRNQISRALKILAKLKIIVIVKEPNDKRNHYGLNDVKLWLSPSDLTDKAKSKKGSHDP